MTNALMELAESIATDMDNFAEEMYQGGSSLYDFAERVRALGKAAEAATQLRTAAAEGGEAVAWVDQYGNLWRYHQKEYVHKFFAPDHGPIELSPLYAHPPTDPGAGRDGEGINYKNVVMLLDTAGFIKEGKLREAINLLYPDTAIAGAAGE